MSQTFLQSFYILSILIVVSSLVIPIFYSSGETQDSLSKNFVIPVDSSLGSVMSFTVSHVELLLQRKIAPQNIAVVAIGKGVFLLRNDNNIYETRLRTLLDEGVQIYACEKSIQKLKKTDATIQIKLMDDVKITADGKKLVNTLMDQGFVSEI